MPKKSETHRVVRKFIEDYLERFSGKRPVLGSLRLDLVGDLLRYPDYVPARRVSPVSLSGILKQSVIDDLLKKEELVNIGAIVKYRHHALEHQLGESLFNSATRDIMNAETFLAFREFLKEQERTHGLEEGSIGVELITAWAAVLLTSACLSAVGPVPYFLLFLLRLWTLGNWPVMVRMGGEVFIVCADETAVVSGTL